MGKKKHYKNTYNSRDRAIVNKREETLYGTHQRLELQLCSNIDRQNKKLSRIDRSENNLSSVSTPRVGREFIANLDAIGRLE